MHCIDLQEAEEAVKISIEIREEVKRIGLKLQEKELLDFCKVELSKDDKQHAKKKKKITRGIRRGLNRNCTFWFLYPWLFGPGKNPV